MAIISATIVERHTYQCINSMVSYGICFIKRYSGEYLEADVFARPHSGTERICHIMLPSIEGTQQALDYVIEYMARYMGDVSARVPVKIGDKFSWLQ